MYRPILYLHIKNQNANIKITYQNVKNFLFEFLFVVLHFDS